jgi:hypothetical protein
MEVQAELVQMEWQALLSLLGIPHWRPWVSSSSLFLRAVPTVEMALVVVVVVVEVMVPVAFAPMWTYSLGSPVVPVVPVVSVVMVVEVVVLLWPCMHSEDQALSQTVCSLQALQVRGDRAQLVPQVLRVPQALATAVRPVAMDWVALAVLAEMAEMADEVRMVLPVSVRRWCS